MQCNKSEEKCKQCCYELLNSIKNVMEETEKEEISWKEACKQIKRLR